MALSNNLERLREEHHYTIKQVALEIDVRYERYRRWDRGERYPPHQYLVKLAKLYKITVKELTAEATTAAGEFSVCESEKELIETLRAIKKQALSHLQLVAAVIKIVADWIAKWW